MQDHYHYTVTIRHHPTCVLFWLFLCHYFAFMCSNALPSINYSLIESVGSYDLALYEAEAISLSQDIMFESSLFWRSTIKVNYKSLLLAAVHCSHCS